MKELLMRIVYAVVENTGAVAVKELETDNAILLYLQVAPGDVKYVIGRDGRMAESLRTILKAGTGKNKKPFRLQIVDCRTIDRPEGERYATAKRLDRAGDDSHWRL